MQNNTKVSALSKQATKVAKTILIVENNKLDIKLLIDFYKLMDMRLPEIPGLEVTKMLKADDYLKLTPVVAVTAFAMKGD